MSYKIKGELLNRLPYTINLNASKYKSYRVVLPAKLNLEKNFQAYQVKRPDGVIELIPADMISPEEIKKYYEKNT